MPCPAKRRKNWRICDDKKQDAAGEFIGIAYGGRGLMILTDIAATPYTKNAVPVRLNAKLGLMILPDVAAAPYTQNAVAVRLCAKLGLMILPDVAAAP